MPVTGRRVFLAGAAGGALIWLASPVVTGYREPWDAPGPYYALSLSGLGIMLGALAPRLFWLAPLAGFGGQLGPPTPPTGGMRSNPTLTTDGPAGGSAAVEAVICVLRVSARS